jgi:hypothetical protein
MRAPTNSPPGRSTRGTGVGMFCLKKEAPLLGAGLLRLHSPKEAYAGRMRPLPAATTIGALLSIPKGALGVPPALGLTAISKFLSER